MFDNSHITPPFASRGRVQALETWREAADLVRIRRRAADLAALSSSAIAA
jgi:hypothetical protein